MPLVKWAICRDDSYANIFTNVGMPLVKILFTACSKYKPIVIIPFTNGSYYVLAVKSITNGFVQTLVKMPLVKNIFVIVTVLFWSAEIFFQFIGYFS